MEQRIYLGDNMRIGSLVRDTEIGDIGLVITTDVDLVEVMFSNETQWLSYTYLEVICE